MVVEMDDEEYASLPVSVDLATAGRAFGLGRTKAFELAKAKQFPCQVIPVGRRADGTPAKYRVARAAIYDKLGEPQQSGKPKVAAKIKVAAASPRPAA